MDENKSTEAEGDDTEAEGRGLGGYLLELEATGLLTQDADPGGTTLIDQRNGFNELSQLAMIWMLCYRWTSRARFVFNCYRHWLYLLLHQNGDAPVIILI